MTARRTLAIAAAALLCGVGDVLLVLGSEHFADPGVWAVFGPVVGLELRRAPACTPGVAGPSRASGS